MKLRPSCVIGVMVECCMFGVEVCKYVCWHVIVKESVKVCVWNMLLWSSVGGGDKDRAVLCVKFYRQEVTSYPPRDKFMPMSVFN